MESTSLRFAHAARVIGEVVAARRLSMPLFRSPPRIEGVQRTLKRRASGVSTIAVRLRGRPWNSVLADMIDGVVVVNRLSGADADTLRDALWLALGPNAPLVVVDVGAAGTAARQAAPTESIRPTVAA